MQDHPLIKQSEAFDKNFAAMKEKLSEFSSDIIKDPSEVNQKLKINVRAMAGVY